MLTISIMSNLVVFFCLIILFRECALTICLFVCIHPVIVLFENGKLLYSCHSIFLTCFVYMPFLCVSDRLVKYDNNTQHHFLAFYLLYLFVLFPHRHLLNDILIHEYSPFFIIYQQAKMKNTPHYKVHLWSKLR